MLFNAGTQVFKQQFSHLIYYSIPTPILFILSKSLNFMMLIFSWMMFFLFSIM